MEDKTINTIALKQQTINELEKLKEIVNKSESSNIRFRVETKHWYDYGLESYLGKKKSVVNISKSTMEIVLNEAINKERERIDKLIDMEIEQRKARTSNANITNQKEMV